ncbi:MAG: hypothetical protein IPI60_00280 [Saprospiraceae bacterium]|nr:hypothetical protein [Saprospiraceae bacterium]
MKKLETHYNAATTKALDICLATNMVATGVDISRLGFMFIHGQPKTTAEYIQASSRVGREVPSGPGLIFTLTAHQNPEINLIMNNSKDIIVASTLMLNLHQ